MLPQLFLLSALLGGPPPSKPVVDQIAVTRAALFPDEGFLVYAVAEEPRSWEITEVYVGPPELKGKIIPGYYRPLPGPGESPTPGPGQPVALGSGVFWIRRNPSGTLRFAQDDPGRVWVKDSALNSRRDYPQILANAKMLQKIYSATDEARLPTVDTILRSGQATDAWTALWQLTYETKIPRLATYRDLPGRVEPGRRVADRHSDQGTRRIGIAEPRMGGLEGGPGNDRALARGAVEGPRAVFEHSHRVPGPHRGKP